MIPAKANSEILKTWTGNQMRQDIYGLKALDEQKLQACL
jgi:hypothetical protein